MVFPNSCWSCHLRWGVRHTFSIPAKGELHVTCNPTPYQCHSERSEESEAIHQVHRSFANRCLGFFTPLHSVQNDSWSASFGHSAEIMQSIRRQGKLVSMAALFADVSAYRDYARSPCSPRGAWCILVTLMGPLDLLATFAAAMTPIGELRLAIPLAIYTLDIPWYVALPVAVAGNMVPVSAAGPGPEPALPVSTQLPQSGVQAPGLAVGADPEGAGPTLSEVRRPCPGAAGRNPAAHDRRVVGVAGRVDIRHSGAAGNTPHRAGSRDSGGCRHGADAQWHQAGRAYTHRLAGG